MILAAVLVVLAAVFTALAKVYKFGPWLEQPPEPQIDLVEPPAPTKPLPTLKQLCDLIEAFEGGPHDLNHRNHNPGNFRCSRVGYLAMYQPVGCVNNFAVFRDYATGRLYMENAIKAILQNHPHLTLYTFIAGCPGWDGYSPASDGNPVDAYVAYLAKGLAVDKGFEMRNLVLA